MKPKFNPDHLQEISGREASERIEGVLRAAGIEAILTGYVTATFPDGAQTVFKPLSVLTERE